MTTSEPSDAAFAERLRRLRTARGWTQAELAEKAGIGKRSVEDYERGNKVPRRAVPAIAYALGVSPDFLLLGVDPLDSRLDELATRVVELREAVDRLEELLADSAESTRRMFGSVDSIVRLLIAQVAPDVLARLPMLPPPENEVGDAGVEGESEASRESLDTVGG
jgi:transcriptional regulator with XRE-family HTH domain